MFRSVWRRLASCFRRKEPDDPYQDEFKDDFWRDDYKPDVGRLADQYGFLRHQPPHGQ